MGTLFDYTDRYEKKNRDGGGGGLDRTKTDELPLQELIAYLYSVMRDDAEMVRVLDRALKERYGDDRARD